MSEHMELLPVTASLPAALTYSLHRALNVSADSRRGEGSAAAERADEETSRGGRRRV